MKRNIYKWYFQKEDESSVQYRKSCYGYNGYNGGGFDCDNDNKMPVDTNKLSPGVCL